MHVDRLTPVAVTGLSSGMHGPGGGFYHSCVTTTGGEIRCWGGGGSGQRGNDMWNDQLTPVTVVELGDPVSSVSTGLVHTCAILPQGRVKCWGSNGYGQLGNNDNSLSVAVPVDALEDEFILRGDVDPM